jgi:hypothetical protein
MVPMERERLARRLYNSVSTHADAHAVLRSMHGVIPEQWDSLHFRHRQVWADAAVELAGAVAPEGSVIVERTQIAEAINLIVDGGPFRTKQAYDILCGLIGASPDANGYVT